MFQIDNSTAVAAIPAPTAPGALGYFTDGNPATGVSATILPAEFMNMLMMENLNVLAAGGITPAKGQYNQLALAIAKIVQSGAAGQASETAAGILKISTSLQAIAGTDDATAITPLKLAQKLANYLVQATESAFGWLKIATQALVSAGIDDSTAVTPKKLAAAIQSQALTAFTTAGSAGALTLTPVPAINAYAAPLRFRVKFSQNSTGTDTINVSGQGAKNLKQYDSTGAKVAAVFAANQLADVEYDGVDVVLLDQLPVTAGLPSGALFAYLGTTAPAGSIKANGAVVSRTTYANIFAVTGTTFGAGDGSTTFGLPDVRAEVIRGWDDGRGIDAARVFGSLQLDAFQGHGHAMFYSALATIGSGGNSYVQQTTSGNNSGPIVDAVRSPISDGTNGTPRIAAETRSRNVAYLYCIKI